MAQILESNDLTPNALEWRKSLYSVGKLLYFSADLALRRAQRLRALNRGAEAQDQFTIGYQRLDDAILRWKSSTADILRLRNRKRSVFCWRSLCKKRRVAG